MLLKRYAARLLRVKFHPVHAKTLYCSVLLHSGLLEVFHWREADASWHLVGRAHVWPEDGPSVFFADVSERLDCVVWAESSVMVRFQSAQIKVSVDGGDDAQPAQQMQQQQQQMQQQQQGSGGAETEHKAGPSAPKTPRATPIKYSLTVSPAQANNYLSVALGPLADLRDDSIRSLAQGDGLWFHVPSSGRLLHWSVSLGRVFLMTTPDDLVAAGGDDAVRAVDEAAEKQGKVDSLVDRLVASRMPTIMPESKRGHEPEAMVIRAACIHAVSQSVMCVDGDGRLHICETPSASTSNITPLTQHMGVMALSSTVVSQLRPFKVGNERDELDTLTMVAHRHTVVLVTAYTCHMYDIRSGGLLCDVTFPAGTPYSPRATSGCIGSHGDIDAFFVWGRTGLYKLQAPPTSVYASHALRLLSKTLAPGHAARLAVMLCRDWGLDRYVPKFELEQLAAVTDDAEKVREIIARLLPHLQNPTLVMARLPKPLNERHVAMLESFVNDYTLGSQDAASHALANRKLARISGVNETALDKIVACTEAKGGLPPGDSLPPVLEETAAEADDDEFALVNGYNSLRPLRLATLAHEDPKRLLAALEQLPYMCSFIRGQPDAAGPLKAADLPTRSHIVVALLRQQATLAEEAFSAAHVGTSRGCSIFETVCRLLYVLEPTALVPFVDRVHAQLFEPSSDVNAWIELLDAISAARAAHRKRSHFERALLALPRGKETSPSPECVQARARLHMRCKRPAVALRVLLDAGLWDEAQVLLDADKNADKDNQLELFRALLVHCEEHKTDERWRAVWDRLPPVYSAHDLVMQLETVLPRSSAAEDVFNAPDGLTVGALREALDALHV